MTDEIVGYFAWTHRNGHVTCEKRDAEIRQNAMPETIKRRDEETVKEHQLTKDQWAMTLDELATEYPNIGI